MQDELDRPNVTVTDIRMPFFSMVIFMVKWSIAAIPALLILVLIGTLSWEIFNGLRPALSTYKFDPTPRSSVEDKTARESKRSVIGESEYLPKIIVKGISVEETTLGGRGVFGEIKNAGNQPLSEVEITIYCLDLNGTSVFDKTYHPVLVSDFSFRGSNAPLKPGYSRKFGVKIDDAPSDWNGKVTVKVTKVKFADAQSGT